MVTAEVELMNWIKIEDAQPEIHEYRPGSGTGCSDPVLVYLDGETENSSTYDVWRMYRGGRGDTTTIHWDWEHPKVTHWKPLEPPKDVLTKLDTTLVFEVSSSAPIPYEYIESLSQHPRYVCIGNQTNDVSINLADVAGVVVDIEEVGDGWGSRQYAHVRVLNTPKGKILAALNYDPLSLKVHFSNFQSINGRVHPTYIEILPKL